MFFEVNQTLWDSLKLNLVPERKTTPHLTSLLKKSGKFILICPALILSQGLALIEKIARYSLSRFKAAPTCSTDSFREILADSRRWKDIKDVKETLLCNPVGSRNQNFLWGVGSCTYQDSGFINCPNSQWKNWEKKILSKENQSNQSVNLYSLYKDNPTFIAEKLIQLGVNSYRTSIEWSQIEPIQGVYCQEALDVYINFFKVLKDHGIEPMVTLHHFSEPTWFHDIGSFEKEQNILCFLNFALFTFPSLTQIYKNEPLVKWICTINEPSIEAFSRYIRGAYSPGVKFNFQRAASFLKGAMKLILQFIKLLNKKTPLSKSDSRTNI